MTDQTMAARPKTLREILDMTPEERHQRAEALAAMFAQWAAEGDPDADSSVSWDEIERNIAENRITFRVPELD